MNGTHRIRLLWLASALFVVLPWKAFAHVGTPDDIHPQNWHELWLTWGLEPGVVLPLALTGWLYARGIRRLRQPGRKRLGGFAIGCFVAGWLSLVIALVSPLHPWGRVLFSVHMTQHEILMLMAAPLLVLSRPMLVLLKALPASWARSIVTTLRMPLAPLHVLLWPSVAWLVHAAALWVWHIPALFDATLRSEWVHAAQHSSFFGSALLFWWAVLHGRHRAASHGMAVLYMFTTAMHSGLLGALLSYAGSLWYPSYANTTASWGLSPVEDQQLGGLIMWIPAGLVYVAAALLFFVGWLREAELRVAQQEKPAPA